MKRLLACSLMVGLAAAWAIADVGHDVGRFDSQRSHRGAKPLRGPKGPQFKAFADGSQEVPPLDTVTRGKLKLTFNEDMTAARFDLRVFEGMEITQAHLHCAPEGVNGPVVVFLQGFIPGGFDVHGALASHTLTDANVAAVGADCVPTTGMEILTLADLAAAAAEGNIYVNVHSVAHPPGEVRGQLVLDDDDDDVDE